MAVLDRALRVFGALVRRAMLRTSRLAPLWRLAYAAFVRSLGVALRLASAEAVYVRGGFARGDPVYGLSDVDLVAVVGAGSRRLRDRARRFYAALPTAKDIVELTVMDVEDLRQVSLSPFPAHACDAGTRRPVRQPRFYGSRRHRAALGARPDSGAALYGPNRRWRHLAGVDPVPALPRSPEAYRWLWSWLELQFAWKHAFRTCANPDSPHAAYLCTTMIAEPARLWMWLADGRPRTGRRVDVLEEALRSMPEEEPALRTALSVRRSLPRPTRPPLPEALAYLARTTARVAGRIAEAATEAGAAKVALIGRPEGPSLPLVDWRARALADAHDERFMVLAGDPADAARVGEVARAAGAGDAHPVLCGGDLLVFPSARRGLWPLGPTAFRSVQCPATDPVSFALLEGRTVAEFPELPGWSAHECAERAVLEHRAWFDAEAATEPSARRRAGMLFSAARAALFDASVKAGEPRLALTAAAVVEGLDGRARELAEAVRERHDGNGGPPPERAVAALQAAIRPLLD